MSDGGKGSSPRPFSVSDEEYKKRWDMIFGRDLESDDKFEHNIVETQEVKLHSGSKD